MVRDEILCALHDPRQIAHAQLARLGQRKRDRQPSRVTKRPEPLRKRAGLRLGGARRPELFRLGKIETEEITAIVGHINIPNAR